MLGALLERQRAESVEQLLKLYWNRAGVKRELKALRRERFELLDKLKEQEGAIVRAQEQLEGLERLLINPLAAANANRRAAARAIRQGAAATAREARARGPARSRNGQA